MTALTTPLTEAYRPDTATSRIPSPWVWIARAAWVILQIPLVYTLVANVGRYYGQLVRMEPVGFYDPEQWGGSGMTIDVVRSGIAALNFSPEGVATFILTLDLLTSGVLVAVGLLIFWRKSDEWLALLTSFVLVAMGFTSSSIAYNPGSVPQFMVLPLFFVATFIWPIFMTLPSIFPNGRFVPGFLRWVAVALFGLFGYFFIVDPLGTEPHIWVQYAIFGLAALSVGGAIYRYVKVSTSLQKQQTKWFLLGVATWLSISILGIIGHEVFQPTGANEVVYNLVGKALDVDFLLIPIGLAFGLLRYRLWDVDFVISRTVVLGFMGLLFVAIAGAVLFAISQLAASLPGGPLVGVAVAAGVFGVTFNPVHKECQKFVDRYFYGIRLDYGDAARAGGAIKPATAPAAEGFGGYTGLALLGRGGMGEVFRAEHPTLNRTVAIKILPESSATSVDAEKRFLREAQTVARLKHPNIITLHDVGDQNGRPFMVMEYVDGKDLAQMIRERGRFPVDEALPILRDLASALDYAHANGVVHRDIKPSNVMVENVTATGSGKKTRAVLMDFGIARSYASTSNLTHSGMIGTLDYISPEQIQGAATVDARADIYSLGVVAYQMLTGELPFRHNNPGAMVLAHLNQPAPDPRTVVADLPENAATAILRAMSKKPEQRFATAGEFVAALGG